MNKNEFELAKLQAAAKARVTELSFKSLNILMVLLTVGFCFYFMMEALQQMVKSNAKALEALSQVVEKLNFAGITSYIVGILGVIYGIYERNTRKKISN